MLIIVCILVVAPCLFLVLGSFKSVSEFFASPFGLPEHYGFSNYRRAWREASVSTTLRNSVIVTGCSVLLSTAVACLASYAIARLPFRGRTVWRLVFVGGLIVPVQLIMIALFIIMRHLGILGTIGSLIIVYTTFGIPLAVLVLVGFFQALPREITEAAMIDGANHFRTFLACRAAAVARRDLHRDHPQRRLDVERLLHRARPDDEARLSRRSRSGSSTSSASTPPSGA